jgi:hypothetical protein
MPREELSWELFHEIKDESGISVRINKLSLRKPIYSFEMGVLKDGGYLNRFFPGGLSWDTDFAGIISELVDKACEFIDTITLKEAEEAAEQESKRLESKRETVHKRLSKTAKKGDI